MRGILFWLGLSSFGLPACGIPPAGQQLGTVRVERTSLTGDQLSAVRSSLSRLPQLIPEEGVRIEPTEAARVDAAGHLLTVTPFVGSLRQGTHDRMTKCLVMLQGSAGEGGVIEREETGFSDDYEPCASIRLKAIMDVNSDGTDDLVYEVHQFDAQGRRYTLLDVYLITPDQRVCFSPKASVRLSSHYSENGLNADLDSTAAQIQADQVLRALVCE